MSAPTATGRTNRSSSPSELRKERQRVIFSSYLGSTIEYYDFLLYASAAALVFPSVFFSNLDSLAATVASYGTFAAGYLARPFGGVIFGHFGDKVGRKKMLMISMFIMGIASTLIGCVPSASSIGSWGAIILVLLRVCQGIAVGGEWGGAALMALEHSHQKSRGFAASFVNAGAPSGSALGTLVLGLAASLTSSEDFLAWGWRIPFLMSFLLLILGLVIRSTVSESPMFTAAMKKLDEQQRGKPSFPIVEVLRNPKTVILTMLGGASGFALQVLLSTFSVKYATEYGAQRSTVLYMFALASIISVLFVISFAALSDRFGRKPVMISGLVLFIAYVYPMFWLLRSNNAFFIFLAFTLALAIHALVFGPLAAFISEQFGTGSRYTGASLGYQFATLIGAGFTPSILAYFYNPGSGASITPVVIFLVFMTIASGIAIFLTRETRHVDIR
ncbi:MFS transporter [Corynebacterium poyangense]|uniref:MFS transporter n=1 Tax=Corynebacterium poyangense TaxID=2684405 RepID=A0A7H0SQK4_9CORY|nr:MFS transporter [Corynebacterium poyangense]QNQ90829.1 MFS transporter [Corynebacterium poyangense]